MLTKDAIIEFRVEYSQVKATVLVLFFIFIFTDNYYGSAFKYVFLKNLTKCCLGFLLGHSVCCHVHGFEPYFYISCPPGMGPDDISHFHQILEVCRINKFTNKSTGICMDACVRIKCMHTQASIIFKNCRTF